MTKTKIEIETFGGSVLFSHESAGNTNRETLEAAVAGTCDLIFEKNGKRYIGDIKTYKKIWDRVPLIQCAGYDVMYDDMTTPCLTSCFPRPLLLAGTR